MEDGASILSSLVICSFANTVIKYFSFPDVRSKWEYDESHVITARRVKKVYWQSQNVGQAGYLAGGWGEMGDFILDPGGRMVGDTVGSRGRTTPCASTRRDSHTPHVLPKVSLPPHHGQQLH